MTRARRPHDAPLRRSCGFALLLAACGGSPAPFALEPPETFVRDIAASEEAARALERDLALALFGGLDADDAARVATAFTADARGRLPALDRLRAIEDATLEIFAAPPAEELLRSEEVLDRDGLVERLREHASGVGSLARTELQTHGFWLDPGGARAIVRFELRLAGEHPDGRRVDLRLACRSEAVRESGAWRLRLVDVEEGTRVAAERARFREITAETGFDFHDSAENRARLQAGVDEHRTFALGGLTAFDANGDGFPDIAATRKNQDAVLFENDGAGGFVPRPLPTTRPSECGSFLLVVDLDGDGAPEMVPSQVQGYEGDRAWLDLFTRVDGAWVRRPRAFEFPNPRGLRRLAIQTLVPFDADGDQCLDLFVAVYGSMLSRGEDYNTVEAHDGADNHLFLAGDDLTFREVSDERGITGTQYTYVATAFDFDGDGDQDLFEGNDFGPNLLWENDGTGRFRANEDLGFAGVPSYTMGATLADFDGSGRWALYVSNMSSEEGMRILDLPPDLDDEMRATVAGIAQGNMLYVQDPASGRWVERGVEMRCNEGEWAWASCFWDPDGDGDRDLFVTNGFASHSDASLPDWQTYYWRQVVADAEFLARGERSRDVNRGRGAPGSFNGYERDRLYHLADGDATRFYEAAWVMGLDARHDGRCAVPLDVDGDGDQDLALWTLGGLRLFENVSPPRRFLRLALRATRTHPAALGAEVTVRVDGRRWRDVVRLVDGFQTQILADLHFGLGDAQRLERVEVRWPSGELERWDDVPLDSRVELVEGEATFDAAPLAAWPEATRPRGARVRLDRFLPRASGGNGVPAPADSIAVVRLIAGAQADEASPDAALATIAPRAHVALVVPEDAAPPQGEVEAFHVDDRLLRGLAGGGPAEWPEAGAVTLVLGRGGRLARVFRRTVAAEELEAVLARLEDEPGFPDLAVLTGRRALRAGESRRAEELFLEALAQEPRNPLAFEGLARVYADRGRLDLAEDAYARAVAADPDYGMGLFNLGVTRTQLGRPADAIAPLEEAVAIQGEGGRAHLALAEAVYLTGDRERALALYRRAAELEPTDLGRALTVAKVLGQLRRFDEARTAYERVLSLDPTSAEGRRGLERVLRLLAGER